MTTFYTTETITHAIDEDAIVDQNDTTVAYLELDDYPMNPREEYEHLGVLVLGPRHFGRTNEDPGAIGKTISDYFEGYYTVDSTWMCGHYVEEGEAGYMANSAAELARLLRDKFGATVVLGLSEYGRDGSLSATVLGDDPTDDGRYDYYLLDTPERRKWAGLEDADPDVITSALTAEAEEFSAYCSGDVYSVKLALHTNGEIRAVMDECSGYYGIESAKRAAAEMFAADYEDLTAAG